MTSLLMTSDKIWAYQKWDIGFNFQGPEDHRMFGSYVSLYRIGCEYSIKEQASQILIWLFGTLKGLSHQMGIRLCWH